MSVNSYPDYRDEALTVTQFVLSPDVPPSERKYFKKYYLMFSKIMALGNIKREDVFGLLLAFDEICMLMEMGLFDEARQIMGREVMKMQCSRSIGGFQTIWSSGGYSKSENIERILSKTRERSTLTGKVKRAFGGKKTRREPSDITEGEY